MVKISMMVMVGRILGSVTCHICVQRLPPSMMQASYSSGLTPEMAAK